MGVPTTETTGWMPCGSKKKTWLSKGKSGKKLKGGGNEECLDLTVKKAPEKIRASGTKSSAGLEERGLGGEKAQIQHVVKGDI